MMQSSKSTFNFWLYAMAGFFVVMLVVCAWTIKIAMDHPVELDNHYRQSYQYVNENINQLLEMSAAFDEQGYHIKLSTPPQIGDNRLAFQLLDKNNQAIDQASIDLLITRRATTRDDMNIGFLTYDNGYYIADNVTFSSRGTWIFNLEIRLDGLQVNRLIPQTL